MRATSLFEDEFEKLVILVKKYLLRRRIILDINIYRDRIIVLFKSVVREEKHDRIGRGDYPHRGRGGSVRFG